MVIEVLNVNEPPIQIILTDEDASQSFNQSNPHIAENNKVGSTVATINGFDGDYRDILFFTLIDDSHGTFTIQSSVKCQDINQHNIKVVCKVSILLAKPVNYEVQGEHDITVRVSDQAGLYIMQKFTVTIIDVNDQPTDILINGNYLVNINEGIYTSQIIGQLSTIDEDSGQLFTYQIVEADLRKYFEISSDQLITKPSFTFDFETKSSFNITVRSTDQSKNPQSIIRTFTVQINDINEKPTAIKLDKSSFQENSRKGTVVGNFTVIDPDNAAEQKQSHSCSISKSSLTDLLIIVNNQLVVNVNNFNYEQVSLFNI